MADQLSLSGTSVINYSEFDSLLLQLLVRDLS